MNYVLVGKGIAIARNEYNSELETPQDESQYIGFPALTANRAEITFGASWSGGQTVMVRCGYAH